MGPRTGDLVRARTDERDASVVEGVLHLRFVPALNYVQVIVLNDDGAYNVDPDSIEILQASVAKAKDIERNDPLRGELGWRPMGSLEEAQAKGLVPVARAYGGATWSDLFARGDQLVQSLLESGWVVTERYAETSYGDPQSVMYSLQRNGEMIDVERYEDDVVVAYRGGANPDEAGEDEATEPLFTADGDAMALSEFAGQGWLAPPA